VKSNGTRFAYYCWYNDGEARVELILLVDDEPGVLTGQRNLLALNGFTNVREARTTDEARAVLTSEPVDLMLLDLTLPEESGQELLREAHTRYPGTAVIVVTGASDVSTAVGCMRAGAYDFLVKGTDSSRIPAAVRNALEHQRARRENRLLREAFIRPAPRHPESFAEFVTIDAGVRRILVYLEALASLPDPLLITGETGVGKELIARGVHRASGRGGEFVAVNMGGVDDHVFSDTLFGHRKGAFTGADSSRDGLVTTAADGTLFLDEVGEMPPESQARLLRMLDSGEFMRLGSDRPEYSRARVIFATNRDLAAEVEAGRFRRDLFFRISTHHVHIPPLRERPRDISLILEKQIRRHADRIGRAPVAVTEDVVAYLTEQPLSGNVRELQQIALRALIDGQWPHASDEVSAGPPVATAVPEATVDHPDPANHAEETDSRAPVSFGSDLPTPEEVVRLLLEEADRRHPGSRAAAARAIGLSPQAFANRWKRMVGTRPEAVPPEA